MQKQKNIKFGVKYFWVICWLEFWRTIVTFDISILEYVIKQYFMQNKKFSNLEPKMSYLYYNFGLYVWKTIAIFEISTLEFIKMKSFVQK